MSACTSAISVTTRLRSEIKKKKLRMASGKCRVLSVSGRNDDRWRNAPGVFWKAFEAFFIISDIYRSLPTSHGNCRCPLYPCYVKAPYETLDILFTFDWFIFRQICTQSFTHLLAELESIQHWTSVNWKYSRNQTVTAPNLLEICCDN